MKLSRLLFAVAVLCTASLPALAQVNDTYVIPAAANASGAFGSRWLTRFSVFNPHTNYPLTISITLVPTGGAQGIEELVEVPANSLAWSDDLLWDLFRYQGSGALLVAAFAEDNPGIADTVSALSFLVTSETYNNDSSGTYGQTIPGVWTGLLDIDYDGISAIAHNIRNLSSQGWRTNAGAVNLGRCTVTVWTTVFDADGREVVNAPMYVPPLAHWQQPLPVQIGAGSVEFYVEDPCAADDARYAVVFPYTSTIDQYSNDPSYQSPTLIALPGDIFSAKSAAATADPASVGKKIGSAYLRPIRENAERRGKATLTRSARGWKIGA